MTTPVPQLRKRLFVIGRLGERHGFLDSSLVKARSERQTVISDVLDIPECWVYARPFRAGRGVRGIHEPFPTVTRTAWERLTDRYLNNPHPADPVPASQAAMLTTRQLAMLQGFPDGWQWKDATRQDVHQMIANAVPSPLAEAIGHVILARENGQSIPDVEGRFMNWLMETGRSPQSARNVKSQVNRARRLLGGRTFSDTGLELTRLELNAEFETLTVRTRSDLRAALRLYAEYLDRKDKAVHSRIAKISRMAA